MPIDLLAKPHRLLRGYLFVECRYQLGSGIDLAVGDGDMNVDVRPLLLVGVAERVRRAHRYRHGVRP